MHSSPPSHTLANPQPATRSRLLALAACLVGVIAAWGLCNAYLQQLVRAQRLQSELSLQQQTGALAGVLAKQLSQIDATLAEHGKPPSSAMLAGLQGLVQAGPWRLREDGKVLPLGASSGLPDDATVRLGLDALAVLPAKASLFFLQPANGRMNDHPLYFAKPYCPQQPCRELIIGVLNPELLTLQAAQNKNVLRLTDHQQRQLSRRSIARQDASPAQLPRWLALLAPGLRQALGEPELLAESPVPGFPLHLQIQQYPASTQLLPPEFYWLPLAALALALFFASWAYRVFLRLSDSEQRFAQQEQSHQLVVASNNTLRERLRKLTASQRDLQTLLDTVQVGVIIMDAAHWQIRASNQRAGELFGWEANDLVGHSAEKLFVEEKDQQLCRRLIGQNIPITDCELRLTHSNGQGFWAMVSMRGLFFNGQPAVGMSVVDISDRIAHAEQLRGEKQETERVLQQLQSVQHELMQLATHDDLTGVANRRHFTNNAEMALQQAQDSGQALSVIMLDIDYFKQVNDTRGHDAGDAILKQTLMLCQGLIRQCDLLGRLGGEEFALLLPDTNEVTALEIAERMRSQVAAHPFHISESFVHITVSLGTASWLPGEAPLSFSALLKAADVALYQAKFEGRNRAFCSRSLHISEGYPNAGLLSAHEYSSAG